MFRGLKKQLELFSLQPAEREIFIALLRLYALDAATEDLQKYEKIVKKLRMEEGPFLEELDIFILSMALEHACHELNEKLH